MTRLATIDPTKAQGDIKATLDAVNNQLGVTPNLFKVAANSAAALNALVHMTGALAKGKLNARVRESIALAVAQANGCDYCLSAHTVLGKGAGLSETEISSARIGNTSDARTRAILDLALAIVRDRGRLDEAAVVTARTAGVSDGEIAEVVGNVALNVFTNYLNLVADTDIDFPPVHATEVAHA